MRKAHGRPNSDRHLVQPLADPPGHLTAHRLRLVALVDQDYGCSIELKSVSDGGQAAGGQVASRWGARRLPVRDFVEVLSLLVDRCVRQIRHVFEKISSKKDFLAHFRNTKLPR